MKIGIMTFHKSQSHGAMLQAYALQETLKKLGNEPEFINYNRFFQKNTNGVSSKTLSGKIRSRIISVVLFISKLINAKNQRKKTEQFDNFRRNYLTIGAQEYNTTEELKQAKLDYDAYVTGSDQVWNPDSINHDAYYFTFLDKSKRTIAYAPSIGVSQISDPNIRIKMKNYLEYVNFLSCREEDGARVIEELTQRRVVNVLDPTFLLSGEEWVKLISNNPKRRPYVLCYFLGSLQYGRKFAQQISKQMGYDLVIIPQSPVETFSLCKKECGVGPIEFLTLFEGASVVCTDSFHGTAFSINLEKPFYSFCRRNPTGSASRLSRLKNILMRLNLSDRLIMPGDKFNKDNLYIDYNESINLLNKEREKSIEYLKNALHS